MLIVINVRKLEVVVKNLWSLWVSQQAGGLKLLFFSCGAGFGAAVCSLEV